MRFETPRCLIRPFQEADLDDFITYRNDEGWMRFQGFKGLSREAYRDALLPPPNPNLGCQLAMIRLADGKLLGDLYLKQQQDVAWIGYTLHPAYTGQGYATEAVQGLLTCLRSSGNPHVFAGVMPENAASIRLLERLGFQYEGAEADGELRYAYPWHSA